MKSLTWRSESSVTKTCINKHIRSKVTCGAIGLWDKEYKDLHVRGEEAPISLKHESLPLNTQLL